MSLTTKRSGANRAPRYIAKTVATVLGQQDNPEHGMAPAGFRVGHSWRQLRLRWAGPCVFGRVESAR